MKILFWGSAPHSIHFLENLYNNKKIEILYVITQPDKPQGRGLKVHPSVVKEVAYRLNLPILTPQKIDTLDFIEFITKLKPDLSIVVSYGKVIPKQIIDSHNIGMLNIHFSLLPKYRGAAPIQWCLINGDYNTGVTLFWMNENLDEGDIFLQKEIELSIDDDYFSVLEKLTGLGCNLLYEAIEKILNNKIEKIPQDNKKATYAPVINKEMGYINWSKASFEIHNLVRALVMWPKAYTFIEIKNKKIYLKILKTYIANNATKIEFEKFKEGTIVKIEKDGILVLCGGNTILKISKLLPENKKVITANEFVCGYRIKVGDRFL